MNLDKPVFRIGKSHTCAQPGDHVWTDELVANFVSPDLSPVVTERPVHGRVKFDGTVLLDDGVVVPLDRCRICEKVIKL